MISFAFRQGEKMEEYLTMKDIELSTKFTRSHIYQLIAKNSFPKGIKIGKARRWKKSEVLNFFEKYDTR